jgi:8-oxo-dGTP diphosphatase
MTISEQGVSSDRYMLIPRTLIFLTRGEHVLLLKGAPDKRLWANRYNGVGGHVEHGEDIITAARRETREETGLNLAHLWLCGVITVDTQQIPGIGIFVVRGECKNGIVKPTHEGTPEWIPISQIMELPLVEDLFTFLPRVLAMRQGDPPFSAQSTYDQNGHMVIHFSS